MAGAQPPAHLSRANGLYQGPSQSCDTQEGLHFAKPCLNPYCESKFVILKETRMKSAKWMLGGVLAFGLVSCQDAMAQGNSQGHGNGKGHDKHSDGDEDHGYYYGHERDIQGWYSDHSNNLPPGLAKKDRLPPGLEKQLVRRGTLPPGLQKRIEPCPPDLENFLPPPPPDCAHVLIGGHIVLLNRRTNVVVDFVHLELF